MKDRILLYECGQKLKIRDFEVVIKHNDTGFSLDIYKNDNLLEDRQFWFDDLEQYYEDSIDK